jgi:hypothetical protein
VLASRHAVVKLGFSPTSAIALIGNAFGSSNGLRRRAVPDGGVSDQ